MMLPEFSDVLLRLVAGRLDDFDAALDNGLPIFGVRRRFYRGENGQIDAERLVGHLAASRDLAGQILRRWLRQRGNESERASIGDGGDQLGPANPLHPALDDWVLDSDQFGKTCLDHFP